MVQEKDKNLIVFFSWQSDLDAKTNRNIIGDCIKDICKKNNLLYDEVTKDRCGSPDIAHTIEEKIRNADIFVADVTIINAGIKFKTTPNPNVLFELGTEFENISKQYRLGLVSTGTLSHDLNRFWQTKILHKEDPYLKVGEVNDRTSKGKSDYVWALKDICKLPHNYVICGGPDIKHLAKELIAPIRNAGPWQRMPETTVEYLEFAPHKYAIALLASTATQL